MGLFWDPKIGRVSDVIQWNYVHDIEFNQRFYTH